MDIEVDYNPTPSSEYFISVGLTDKEAISFDNTIKGFRVIKQVLLDEPKKTSSSPTKISGEWDAIVLKDGKFIKKYHVVWQDKNTLDIVNGETWKLVWEKPITEEVHKKLLAFSHFVSDNYEKLDGHKNEMTEFENFLSQETEKYQGL